MTHYRDSALYRLMRIVEIRTKTVSMSAFAIGTLYAVWHAGAFEPTIFLLMGSATLLVDMGTTAFNSYFDFTGGVDTAEFNREGDKVLLHHPETKSWTALLVGAICFAISMPIGIALALRVGFEVVLVGAASMAVGFLYNAGPIPLSRTPLGELFAGGFLGSVLVLLSYYVQTQSLDTAAVLVSVPSLLVVASILTVNNTCDIVGDRAAGRHTFSIVFGTKAAGALIYTLGLGGFGLVAFYAAVGLLPVAAGLLAVPTFLLALGEYRRMHRRGYSHDTKGASMQSVLKILIFYSTASAGGLAVALLTA